LLLLLLIIMVSRIVAAGVGSVGPEAQALVVGVLLLVVLVVEGPGQVLLHVTSIQSTPREGLIYTICVAVSGLWPV
jgi:hypothetical protein